MRHVAFSRGSTRTSRAGGREPSLWVLWPPVAGRALHLSSRRRVLPVDQSRRLPGQHSQRAGVPEQRPRLARSVPSPAAQATEAQRALPLVAAGARAAVQLLVAGEHRWSLRITASVRRHAGLRGQCVGSARGGCRAPRDLTPRGEPSEDLRALSSRTPEAPVAPRPRRTQRRLSEGRTFRDTHMHHPVRSAGYPFRGIVRRHLPAEGMACPRPEKDGRS